MMTSPMPPQWQNKKKVEQPLPHPDDTDMDTPSRHEMNARLEANEARVASAVDGIRGELATMRAEASANSQVAQARAEEFYAQARSVLTEIRLSNEQQKVTIYGIGYKVIAWTLGTILAVGGVALGAWRAFSMAAGTG